MNKKVHTTMRQGELFTKLITIIIHSELSILNTFHKF